ncbi:probable RNA 2'-phosphotransferase [Ylistrum balloti]|uniref:probable RNA 2'-phosphotransferase n=1 Tax=Ylistrum balloti TaxID=509963 RepID=UPI00290591BB|nr:probable RNA 2'-phosphotransferase [Ylistrum balloti]
METLSRRLVAYLRHDPTAPRDSAGYVPLDHLANYCRVTRPLLLQVVSSPTSKQRLFLSPCGEKLRAGAGHSVTDVNLEDLATPVTDSQGVQYCRHATTAEAWSIIRKEGLRVMSRRYVHFADRPAALRPHCKVVISLKVGAYLRAGQKLYRLPNGCYAASGNRYGIVRPCFLTARTLPR